MPSNQRLYNYYYQFLCKMYQTQHFPPHLVGTLALLLTGLLLGRHVQLWEMALLAPQAVQLQSIVRRFERFLADPRVVVQRWFAPFVKSIHQTLGYEVAYLIIDCTQAGSACRTLMVGLAYHGSILPLAWRSLKGRKGHVKGTFQTALLAEVAPTLRYYHRILLLGDGEFSNETLVRWLLNHGWDFVLRIRSSCLCQVTTDGAWQAVDELVKASALQPGTVHHWPAIVFTQAHQIPDLTLTVQWGRDQRTPLPLLSTLSPIDAPHRLYEMRFWIETLFANYKSRGFQLARTHSTDPQQLDRLLLVLAIATYLLLGAGTAVACSGKTTLVERTQRCDLSLFQLGFRTFCRLLACDRLDQLLIFFVQTLPSRSYHSVALKPYYFVNPVSGTETPDCRRSKKFHWQIRSC